MESNKENCKKLAHTTRIPLPVLPLPPVPINLIKSKCDVALKRVPFRDLKQSENVAQPGPSKVTHATQNQESLRITDTDRELKKVISGNPIFLDTRHVTLRRKSEELDWNYRVFEENSSCVYVSDEDKACTAITPLNIENKAIKKLKRSLKRPHSRELLGLNENGEQRKDGCLSSANGIWRLDSSIFLTEEDYVQDMFNHLMLTESVSSRPAPRVPSHTRACVINWLVKVNANVIDGNPAAIQTACWYFDQVLTQYEVALHNMQLVAAACYWVALKIHGNVINGKKLARFAGHAFTVRKLAYAEESILQKLRFPSSPVIPHEYITYLSWWCDPDSCGEIEAASSFLCLAGLMVSKNLCAELPSTIAAACVKNALVLLKRRELLHQYSTCFLVQDIEEQVNYNALGPLLRTAIRLISQPSYEYNALVKFYEGPPFPVAKKIIEGAHEMVHIDPGYSGSLG